MPLDLRQTAHTGTMNRRLRNATIRLIKFAQFVLLITSFQLFRLFNLKKITWVVGPDELAGVLQGVATALPDSYSVNLSTSSLRHESYDFTLGSGPLHEFRRLLFGPLLLGYLANKTDQFYYIWNRGFLFDRTREFRFLKEHDIRLAIMFCGDDIRSPVLHSSFCKELGRDSFVNYDFYVNPPGGKAVYEERQRATALDADSFADVIFNAPVCQTSYLPSNSSKLVAAHGFIAIADRDFCYDSTKLNDQVLKVVHAPSSMAVKGTAFVREAINRLSLERDDFVYYELNGVPHPEVLKVLQASHVCLNQFLSFGTGVLGIEALASRCATLMSADPKLEPSIPTPHLGQIPWLITGPQDIYENLRLILDDRELLKQLANSGFDYALEHYSLANARDRLRDSLTVHGFECSDPQ